MLLAQQLLEAAAHEAGLDDYGDREFEPGFRVLVDSINAEAGLGSAAEAKVGDELRYLLVNLLRMQRDIVLHPEILDEVILPPIFITSLPRTGSTKLHRLLAASGEFNVMKFWHAYSFGRLPEGASGDPEQRIQAADRYLSWLREKSPMLAAAHPMYTDDTEEESILLDSGFNSVFRHGMILNIPSYIGWAMQQDPRLLFRTLHRKLQYLQWQHFRGSKKRWLLKTPALFGMEATFSEVFQDADFIVTHRQLEPIAASACTLFIGFHSLYSDQDYSAMAAPVVLGGFALAVDAHLKWREKYPQEKILDVRFSEVTGDEMALARKIFGFLNIPVTQSCLDNMRSWLAMDTARREPPSHFPLSNYGLDVATVNARFAAYIRRYADYL